MSKTIDRCPEAQARGREMCRGGGFDHDLTTEEQREFDAGLRQRPMRSITMSARADQNKGAEANGLLHGS